MRFLAILLYLVFFNAFADKDLSSNDTSTDFNISADNNSGMYKFNVAVAVSESDFKEDEYRFFIAMSVLYANYVLKKSNINLRLDLTAVLIISDKDHKVNVANNENKLSLISYTWSLKNEYKNIDAVAYFQKKNKTTVSSAYGSLNSFNLNEDGLFSLDINFFNISFMSSIIFFTENSFDVFMDNMNMHYSFIHELGHNFGLNHDPRNVSKSSSVCKNVNNFGRAECDSASGFYLYTVMAYGFDKDSSKVFFPLRVFNDHNKGLQYSSSDILNKVSEKYGRKMRKLKISDLDFTYSILEKRFNESKDKPSYDSWVASIDNREALKQSMYDDINRFFEGDKVKRVDIAPGLNVNRYASFDLLSLLFLFSLILIRKFYFVDFKRY